MPDPRSRRNTCTSQGRQGGAQIVRSSAASFEATQEPASRSNLQGSPRGLQLHILQGHRWFACNLYRTPKRVVSVR